MTHARFVPRFDVQQDFLGGLFIFDDDQSQS
jgi:hypothetical protein